MLILQNGKTLRQIRQECKIPVKTLADRLGVSEGRVYSIERANETSYALVMKYLRACYKYYDGQRVASEQ